MTEVEPNAFSGMAAAAVALLLKGDTDVKQLRYLSLAIGWHRTEPATYTTPAYCPVFRSTYLAIGETMTLQQLRVLVAVIEQRSFTRGGATLYLTQSAASQHIRSLEHAVGVTLLERRGTEVVPTPAGETLLAYAREMLRIQADAERHLSTLRTGNGGRVTVGVCGSAVYLVPTLFAGFRAAYAETDVSLQVLSRPALLEALSQGSVDLALMSGPVRADDLAATTLCPDRLVLATSPGTPLLAAASLAPYPLDRLVSQPLIAPPETSPSWQLVQRWAAAHGVELRPALRLDHPDAIKKAVEAGAGVAFLSAWVVEREVALGTLRLAALAPSPPSRQYVIVRRQTRPVDATLEAILTFAPEYLSRHLPLHLTERAPFHDALAARGNVEEVA